MREYTKSDCDRTGVGCSLKGRVVVLNRAALPPGASRPAFPLHRRERGEPEPHRAERVSGIPLKRGKLPVLAGGCEGNAETGSPAG